MAARKPENIAIPFALATTSWGILCFSARLVSGIHTGMGEGGKDHTDEALEDACGFFALFVETRHTYLAWAFWRLDLALHNRGS